MAYRGEGREVSQRPSDHPGWTEALAGVETDSSRAFVRSRAKDMASSLLRSLTEDETIACTVPQWKRDIYAAELRGRPAVVTDEGRAAA
jgi:hypothetical protein